MRGPCPIGAGTYPLPLRDARPARALLPEGAIRDGVKAGHPCVKLLGNDVPDGRFAARNAGGARGIMGDMLFGSSVALTSPIRLERGTGPTPQRSPTLDGTGSTDGFDFARPAPSAGGATRMTRAVTPELRMPPSARPRPRGPGLVRCRERFRRSAGVLSGCVLLGASLLVFGCGDRASGVADPPGFARATFADPPRAAGPMVRWWWPGGAVDDATLRASLESIADAGYAEVELQPLLLGLADGDVAADPRVRTVGEEVYLGHLRAAAGAARELGLGWHLTLGSGWPNGGPEVAGDLGEQQLLLATAAIDGPGSFRVEVPRPGEPAWVRPTNNVLPAIGAFDEDLELVAVLTAPLLDEAADPPLLGPVADVTPQVRDGVLAGEAPAGRQIVLAAWRNRVHHLVLGGAFPGTLEDARVIDHLDPAGLDAVLRAQADVALDAVAGVPPATVFIDSFELIGDLPWTKRFAERFAAEAGVDAAPLLPFFFRDFGESVYVTVVRGLGGPVFATDVPDLQERAREEYEAVRETLFHEAVVERFVGWGRARGVGTRLQGHGGHGDTLDDDAAVDVPEAEGLYGGGSYDFLKLASSAAHVAGRPEATSESFVLVNTAGTAYLTQDDLWRLAGRAFAAGITRLVHHGVPYPYTRANGARWYPFQPSPGALTAGPLPITSEIRPGEEAWAFLPDFNRAQARLTYALTRGEPSAEVAWLFADRQYPQGTNLTFGSPAPEAGESATSLALRRAGYGYDRVSRAALAGATFADGVATIGAARYRALLVDRTLAGIEPEVVEALQRATDAGVPVVLAADLPSRATGLRDAAARDARVRAAAQALVSRAERAAGSDDVPAALARRGVRPAVSVTSGAATLSTLVRLLPDGSRLVLLFNEARADGRWTVRLAAPAASAVLLDPETGAATPAELRDGAELDVALPAARARVLLLRPA